MRTPRRFRRSVATMAMVCAGALTLPAIASADPAPTDPLQQALSALEASGSTGDALDAGRAVFAAAPEVAVAEPAGSDPLALLNSANALMTGFGLTPFFYPTAAINCSAIPGVPLGVVPAVAGAAGGPYTPRIPGVAIPAIPGIDTRIADPGETLYAFVPAPGGIVDDGANKSGMQVAWFNVNTLQGGFADMGGATDVILDEIIDPLPEPIKGLAAGFVTANLASFPNAGVRLAPVATGSGTVLSAVFGQVTHGGKTCAFFPTVGLTTVR